MAHDDGRRHHSEATPMRTDLRLCVWIGISMRFYITRTRPTIVYINMSMDCS